MATLTSTKVVADAKMPPFDNVPIPHEPTPYVIDDRLDQTRKTIEDSFERSLDLDQQKVTLVSMHGFRGLG